MIESQLKSKTKTEGINFKLMKESEDPVFGQ